MDIRVLRYFLTVVQEENITKAAEVLHVTQPTLSRQIAQMEEQMGVKLFQRGARKITLTNEGLLLRRRAEEILELVDKTERELAGQDGMVTGTVSVGCGDLAAEQRLPELFQAFQKRYPAVSFDLYTATADWVKDQMDRGLTDVGLLLEPIDMDMYDFIRMPRWRKRSGSPRRICGMYRWSCPGGPQSRVSWPGGLGRTLTSCRSCLPPTSPPSAPSWHTTGWPMPF